MITVPERHGQTDRQTDGQTTYCGITALCIASRGKNSPDSQVTLALVRRGQRGLVSVNPSSSSQPLQRGLWGCVRAIWCGVYRWCEKSTHPVANPLASCCHRFLITRLFLFLASRLEQSLMPTASMRFYGMLITPIGIWRIFIILIIIFPPSN